MWASLLAYGLWGLMPLYFRLMAPAGAVEVVAHRVVWSFVLLAALLGARRQIGALWRRLDAAQLARFALAALLVSINWLTYVWAVTHGRTLDASLGYFLLPLFNVALGVLLLGERLTRGEWIGVMLAALGVGYLALVSPRLPWVALVLAASFGVYGLVKKQTELPEHTQPQQQQRQRPDDAVRHHLDRGGRRHEAEVQRRQAPQPVGQQGGRDAAVHGRRATARAVAFTLLPAAWCQRISSQIGLQRLMDKR